MTLSWIRPAVAGLAAAVLLSACGSSAASPSTTPSGAVTAPPKITTLHAATSALEAKLPGWTIAVVALPAGGFEAAAYDTTGQINRWTYAGHRWALTARARWPRGANGTIEGGPAQHLYQNAAPTGIAGGMVTGMKHATFVLSMSAWSDSVSSIGPADLVYTTSAAGVFGTVQFRQDALGNNKALVPGEVEPQKIGDLALESPYASVAGGLLLTPNSQANSWRWIGIAFVSVGQIPAPRPSQSLSPSGMQAPCGNWGLPAGSRVEQLLYCKDGWAVLGYSQPGVPARETFRAHYVDGKWQHADNLCFSPTPEVPRAWVAACQVG